MMTMLMILAAIVALAKIAEAPESAEAGSESREGASAPGADTGAGGDPGTRGRGGAGAPKRGDAEAGGKPASDEADAGTAKAKPDGKAEDDEAPDVEDFKLGLRAKSKQLTRVKGERNEATAEVQRLRDENARLLAQIGGVAAKGGGKYLDAGIATGRSELAGRNYDPENKVVEIEPGEWESPSIASQYVRNEQLHASRGQSEKQQAEGQRQADLSEIHTGLQGTISKAFDGLKLPAAAKGLLQPGFGTAVLAHLRAEGIDLSDLEALTADPDAVASAVAEGLAKARRLTKAAVAEIVKPQTEANEEADRDAPLRGGGPAGRPAVDRSKETPRERQARREGFFAKQFSRFGFGEK